MNDYLIVKIQSPREILFDGKAYAVSSQNTEGKFDILPQHANFLTIIENTPIIITTIENQKLTFNFHQAIILNLQNLVSIYADPKSNV